LVYYGNQRQLEYDFVVEPGADPNQIKLSFAGVDGMRVDEASGDLVLKVGDDEMRFRKPNAFQPADTAVSGSSSSFAAPPSGPEAHRSSPFPSSFVLARNNQVAFRLAGQDPLRALVIDPILSYSTFLGGSGGDQAVGIAVDSSGNAYVTGYTYDTNFPTTPEAFQTMSIASCGYAPGPIPCAQAIVFKLNAEGSVLVYSTYLNGTTADYGHGIAVDSSGNAIVTGWTISTDFPLSNPIQAVCGGACEVGGDVFVTEFNAAGSALLYSTFLGGEWG
jgi:hypothetical protein